MKINIKLVQLLYIQEISSVMALDANGAIWSYSIKDNPTKSWLMVQGPCVEVPDPQPAPPPQLKPVEPIRVRQPGEIAKNPFKNDKKTRRRKK